LLIVLLKHKQPKCMGIKIGIHLLVFALCFLLAQKQGVMLTMFEHMHPNYGRMSAGGGFAVFILLQFYLAITGIAVLASLSRTSDKRKREAAATKKE
jgi:hypothetical protein